ncbi:unnamed protein product [Phaeothamnion confervicola]
MLRKHTFVGMVDMHLSLIQFHTKLIFVDHLRLGKEAFYQMAIRRFGVMRPLELAGPLRVKDVVRTALELPESHWTEEDGPKDELAEEMAALLTEKGPMLSEYFRICIDAEGRLTALPELFEGHSPLPEGLPMFLLRLATDVDWLEERACFHGVAMELSHYYSMLPEDLLSGAGGPEGEEESANHFSGLGGGGIGGGSSGSLGGGGGGGAVVARAAAANPGHCAAAGSCRRQRQHMCSTCCTRRCGGASCPQLPLRRTGRWCSWGASSAYTRSSSDANGRE